MRKPFLTIFLIKLDGKKRKEKKEYCTDVTRNGGTCKYLYNSLFVRRPNAAYENKKKREKNKNLKKAHVHALNKRPIFTFGFAENVDG